MGWKGRNWRRAVAGGAVGLGACLLAMAPVSCTDVAVSEVARGDTYLQEGGHIAVDVLWVVDSSGTMAEEQATLVAGVDTFMKALLDSDVDFHLGVITTDMREEEDSGRLQGDPVVLDRSTPDLRNLFRERAQVGIEGSPEERAFDAVVAALSEPLQSGANAGFLRPEAELALIFVSDEDDQSELDSAAFESFLDALKPDIVHTVSGLVGDVPYGCASSTAAADPAPRYLQVVQDNGGVSQSICSDSFEELMTRLVRLLNHIQDTFLLSRIPDPSSIAVEVDDVVIRNREQDGWQYLPALNAVRISGTALPKSGQEVYITYDGVRFD